MEKKIVLEQVLEQAREELAKKENLSSDTLQEANTYIKQEKIKIQKEKKPAFHFSGEVGWINDPNGFSYYNDAYHLFYQYHPFDTKWGPMHWGHAVSEDFIKWRYLPVALAPDSSYDDGGCFSGSAIQVEDLHILMYTGNKEEDIQNSEVNKQVQCMAIGDGCNYLKIKNNPVIDMSQIPDHSSSADFRDPKIWRKGDTFYAVIGSRHDDGSGQILLYHSNNLLEWNYSGTLLRSENKLGRMWECPDLFELEGKDVLIISPQQMQKEEHKFHNEYGTVYMIGKVDYTKGSYEYSNCDEIDYGLDFYAPQTLKAADGRRIMIAWMQTWERNIPSAALGWAGAMTIPRELYFKENKLCQRPVEEIKKYRRDEVTYNQVNVRAEAEFEGISGRHTELELDIFIKEAEIVKIKLAKRNEANTKIIYNAKEQLLIFDRGESQSQISGLNKRSMPVRLYNHKLKLRILIDRFAVEIFANDGEGVMTSTIYTPIEAESISFESDKNVLIDIKKWDLVIP